MIIHNITDLPRLCKCACVFPVAVLLFAQYARSILEHTISDHLILAFVASTQYTNQDQSPVELFLTQTIDRGCPQILGLSNGSQALQTLFVMDDTIEKFSAFLQVPQEGVEVETGQNYRIDIKPELVSYPTSLTVPSYYSIVWEEKKSRPHRAKETL